MSTTADLRGKRILVVGGETAIGRALAVALAEAGADVAIASLSGGADAEFAVNSALNELWAMGRKGLALAIDATDAVQLREALDRAGRELGRLDLAAVVSVEERSVALDELRAALGEREVVVVRADATPDDALRNVAETLRAALG